MVEEPRNHQTKYLTFRKNAHVYFEAGGVVTATPPVIEIMPYGLLGKTRLWV